MWYIMEWCLTLWWAAMLTTPLDKSDRYVVLADAYRFGLTAETARANWKLAQWFRNNEDLKNTMLVNHGWQGMRVWINDCERRHEIWYLVDDVLDTNRSPQYRLLRLNDLRQRLGDDAFFAGWLPAPNPQCRVKSLDNR